MTAAPETTPPTEPADTRPPVPAWITNPDLIASIETGFIDIDDLTGDCNA